MSEQARLYGFFKDDVPDIWPEMVPWIEKGIALAERETTLLEIYVALLAREKQLWGIVKDGDLVGSGLTHIVFEKENNIRICWIYALAADRILVDAPGLAAQLTLWAKANGCHVLRLTGRKGWRRVFPDWGWFIAGDGTMYLEKIL